MKMYHCIVFRDKKVQKVRAGTVVYIDDGKGFAVGKSLFDNLFVVGDKGISLSNDVAFDSDKSTRDKPSAGGAEIKATFDGDIVIATDKAKWTSTSVEDSVNKGDYFYTAEEKEYQLKGKEEGNDHSLDDIKSRPNTGGKAVRNDSLAINSNVTGFLSKLGKQHFDLKKNCAQESTDADAKINNINATSLNNSIRGKDKRLGYHYTITTTNPPTANAPASTVIDYFHTHENNNGNRLVSCVPRDDSDGLSRGKAYELVKGKTDIYYSLLSEGYQFKYYDSSGNLKGPTTCFTYVFDNKGNQIFCNYDRNKDQWTFYRKNVLAINPDTTRVVEYRQLYAADKNAPYHDLQELSRDEKGNRRWSYRYPTYDDEIYNFTIETKTINYSTQKVKVNEPQMTNFNVFHWESDGWESKEKNIPLTLTVDGLQGNDSYPLYIILTGNEGTPITIKVTQSYDDRPNDRPVIFCNLTTNEINFSIETPEGRERPVLFKGMIYSPFAKVVNALPVSGSTGGRFLGNIVAEELAIQDGSITWAHKNYLADDSDLNEVSDNAATAQENRQRDAVIFAKTALGVTDSNWADPDWFGTLTPDQQDAITAKWNTARQTLWETEGLDMPDWPWKVGGKTTDINKQHYSAINYDNGPLVEIVRVINFRTEYRTDPYINPFTHLYLPDD